MEQQPAPIVVWRRAAKNAERAPLVVLLHGRGADEHDLISLADRLPRSWTYAAVRGGVEAEGGYTWFESRAVARPVSASLRASVTALRDWLDAPPRERFARTYLLGFSAGMMMAGALLLDAPERFAGAVLLSGALALDEATALPGRLAGVPVFLGRGALDTVIPARLVERTDTYLRDRSGADLSPYEYRHAHTISRREIDDIADWLAARG